MDSPYKRLHIQRIGKDILNTRPNTQHRGLNTLRQGRNIKYRKLSIEGWTPWALSPTQMELNNSRYEFTFFFFFLLANKDIWTYKQIHCVPFDQFHMNRRQDGGFRYLLMQLKREKKKTFLHWETHPHSHKNPGLKQTLHNYWYQNIECSYKQNKKE